MIRPEMFVETKANSRTPLLNYVERASSNSTFSDYAQIARKKRLQYLVLRTPELAGMLWDIAEDIVGRFEFKAAGKFSSGRNRIINARRWSHRSHIYDTLLSAVFDVLSSGEGYIYLGAKATEIRAQLDSVLNQDLKDKIYDEAIYSPLFQPIATTTMTNNHDNTKLINYTQRISGIETNYAPREIIHLFFKRLAGKVDGFSPVATIPLQLELLWLLWTNQYDLQAKGNMPDLIVTAEDVKSNTPALKDVEQKLRQYNMPGNSRHGTTLLYGGKYSFEKMERDTSLQFEDVGKAVTSVMASLFRYPKHRLGIKTKESASDTDSQGNSDRDYWDMIMKYQSRLADFLDTQLFEPFFGVNIVFEKSYKHDSVVENTAMRSRIDNINLINNMLRTEGKQFPQDVVVRFIAGKDVNFDLEKLEDVEIPEFDVQQPMMGTPGNPKDEQRSADKKQAEQNAQKNTGGVRKQ
jgi:hypothetical protein